MVTEETKQKQREVWIKRKQNPNYDPKIYGHFGKNNPFFGKTHSPKTKQLISDANTGRLVGEKNPNYGKTFSPETKQKMRENHADFKGENHPQYGTHQSDKTKQKISDWMNDGNHPMLGKTHSEETILKMKKAWEKRKLIPVSDETKHLISINHADVSGENNPNYGKPMSDNQKQKISKNLVGKYCGENSPNYGKPKSEEHKRKISINHSDVSGENNPNWKGGIARSSYCPIWTKWLKEEIKERDNHQCQNPDCTSIEDLCVHHIDYNKKNCSVDNLITLCRSCNSRANADRDYWKEFYNSLITNQLI